MGFAPLGIQNTMFDSLSKSKNENETTDTCDALVTPTTNHTYHQDA